MAETRLERAERMMAVSRKARRWARYRFWRRIRNRELRRTPKIVTAHQLGLRFANVFGALGPEENLTGHHTAGPKDRDLEHAIALCRSYHNAHAAKGWGGEGYHWSIARDGTIIGLRPTALKGAHVGGHNSRNAGVMFHGTTGDKPTAAQRRSYAWLLANAHTSRMPKAHRTDRALTTAGRRGHKDWSGHASNACPGTHHDLILKGR